MTELIVHTVTEAAHLLRISRNAAYAAVRARQIPSVRIGRRVLVPRHALLALTGVASVTGGAAETAPAPGRAPRLAA